MFKHCLICTEFSDGLERLAKFVPSLAQGGLEKIVFLHCIPVWEQETLKGVDPEAIAAAEAKLAPALEEVPSGVEVKIEIASDRPLDVVPRLVKTYGIDLILVGSPFRSSLEEKITGNTALAIAKATEVPMMIFRPQFFSLLSQEELKIRCANLWRSLLIPYNEDASSQYLVEKLKTLASQGISDKGQSCLLLSVIESTGRREVLETHRQAEAQAKLTQIQQQLQSLGVDTEISVQVGDSIYEIFKLAAEQDISAIAIATLYQKSLFDWAVPKVNEEMLRRSWFPLLFISPKK